MIEFNTVEEALEDLRRGRIILVTDDQDRENEGDFICAAEFATTENVNFMASVDWNSMMMRSVLMIFVCAFWISFFSIAMIAILVTLIAPS